MRSVIIIIGMVAASTASAQTALDLKCTGSGTATERNVNTASAYDSEGGHISATGTSTQKVGYNSQVDVKFFSGDDRIRLPPVILPPIRGGDNGWFKVKDIVATEREITGHASINAFNRPMVRIDRVSGTIEITGSGGYFTGMCQKVAPETEKPKF